PFHNLESYRIASVALGSGKTDAFSESLPLYTAVDTFLLPANTHADTSSVLRKKLSAYNTLIVSIHNTSQWPSRRYGISPAEVRFIDSLDFKGNLMLVVFGNPYLLDEFNKDELDKFDAVVVAYADDPETKSLAAQAIFGASEMSGTLPVSCGPGFGSGTGVVSPAIQRLSYGIPEETGLDSKTLMRIDTIAEEAISIKATPGCQVVVGRHGEIVFSKSYGSFTYRNEHKVENNDLYDLASLTKIFATLPSLMRLSDQGKFDVDKTLGDYMAMPDSCNKKDLVIKDVLTHQSGLVAWIPFYLSTLEPMDTSELLFSTRFSYEYPYKMGPHAYANRNIQYVDSVYADTFSLEYPIKVARGLYLRNDYIDTIYNDIFKSELLDKEYRYSDLGYYLFKRIIENETDTALYPYVYHNFYARIGAATLGYLPLNRFPANRIAPTENDIMFRRQLLQGYVHDPGAAMLGGIGGHAGLFSDANDLAKIMQMYLNGGTYGGRRFLSDTVIHRFSARVYSDNGNRRGLGFDKPEPEEDKIGPTCKSASPESFGHTGFTGTMAWADPRTDIVYIFLSNRINPNQYNTLLVQKDIRTRIQQTIYDALIDPTQIR
ncbi:MAG TPA: serine hydrolase, partial [Bacteroidales bacterium]|nr:serine hydrolase [Bacteroidales bacterium]